ncbi:MAG: SBBP repeat-containing protein [Phycisphaeraceae bacterium]|nr:SBBP repeat-containing protein [Phycisphaeraceae bacterium]
MPSRSPRSEFEFQGIEPLEPRLLLSTASPTVELFQGLTPLFVENQGQWSDADVRYAFGSGGVNVAFTDTGLRFQIAAPGSAPGIAHGNEAADPLDDLLHRGMEDELADATWITTEFSLSFTGAHAVSPVGVDMTATRNNYLLGSPDQWRQDVPTYHGVAYYGLYDGVDLFITGQAGQLKYEFHVAPPGSDSGDPTAAWQQIQLDYDGVAGLSLTDDGGLWIDLLPEGLGHLTDQAPVIYQDIDGQRVNVAGHFDLRDGDAYGFSLTQAYDATHPLILDPEIAWSTYLGGIGHDYGNGIAVDSADNILVTGYSSSSDWVSGGPNTNPNTGNDYIIKLSPTGEHLWSTYILDGGNDIATDSQDNILITGVTYTPGWVSGGYDTSYGGATDAYVLKLSPTGGHLWSTYLGGSSKDDGYGIAVDGMGNILVTGDTRSSGWVSGGYNTSFGGNYEDAFAVKLSPTGEHLWSTYLGGNGYDIGRDIAVDGSGNVLVTGSTESFSWVSGGYDTSYNGGYRDAFVVKLSPTGGHLQSTYLGRFDYTDGYGIAVDDMGNVLVTGTTASDRWVYGGYDSSYNGGYTDAFVVKLSPILRHRWSTYLGGNAYQGGDRGYDITVDGIGDVLVTGGTDSPGWVSGGPDTIHDAGEDVFVVKISPDGSHLWSTFLGGNNHDHGHGIAVDGSGNVLVMGDTLSSGWVSGGYDTSYGGGYQDPFVVKITADSPTIDFTSITGGQQRSPVEIVLEAFDPDSVATLSIYYDTDDTGENGKLIAGGLTEADGALSLTWDVTQVPAGNYWLYAVISDGIHDPVVRYASAPIAVAPRLDAYDPNDTIEQAADLGVGDQHLTDLLLDDTSTDIDWFRWTASHDGVVRISLYFDDVDNDMLLSIYDDQARLVAVSRETSFGQELRINVVAGQTLRLRVEQIAGPFEGRYTLRLRESVPGDLNHDGRVNIQDINSFVYAMIYPLFYKFEHQDWDVDSLWDLTGDGQLSIADINPFVDLILGRQRALEPGDNLEAARDLDVLNPGDNLTFQDKIGNSLQGNFDIDLYRLELPVAGLLTLTVNDESGKSILSSAIRLFDAQGNPIGVDADPSDLASQLSVAMDPGVYFIGVSSVNNTVYDPHVLGSGLAGSTTGIYTLTLQLDEMIQLASLALPTPDAPAPITAPVAPSSPRFAPLESSSSHASAKPWWTPARPMFENLGRSAWLWEHWSAMCPAAESAT